MIRALLTLLAVNLSLLSESICAGEIAEGREKSLLCVSCHGAEGVSDHLNWPNLAGQNAGYIEKQLLDFRAGTRSDPWMSPMALGLTDSDIDNLAVYFSNLQPAREGGEVSSSNPKASTCTACHGQYGIIEHDLWPNLRGQKKLYLAEQLKRFRSGERVDPLMSPMAKNLSDQDIEELAEFYSAPHQTE